ncbi:AAA family ATPase [Cryobacterium sp. 5B3]|uniref:AAA family ATPase n=1 Tax=Cryobacterium sp. 5B3 TaxID=3048586 RepID=UPI002AB3EA86|nr:AAA family ATPase [Cryobacterium sp. 5B3]MDY7541829.1 AAA family ATPase [Cryobacterium sp. 5B3]MEB0274241.1 AAA family ATPase [Cryobacterium sp. 5B3]
MANIGQLHGARWWKVDFHAHSPSSFDFGSEEGSKSEVVVDVSDWLATYMAAGIDAIVVTDHNTHAGIDVARASLNLLRGAADSRFRELVIFPGVELTTPEGYHLLAVFEHDVSSDVVNGVLHKCGYAGTRGTSDATTTKSFQEVVGIITEDGGLAIPAHADGPAGLFGMDPRNISALRQQNLVFAVEMVTSDTKPATDLGWVPILGSDAHHLDASGAPNPELAKFPGSHFTWAKLGRPTLAGIRLAILDGPSSLIRSIDQGGDPNRSEHSSLTSLVVRNHGHQVEYPLSPWMNAIIGGRGTGKSTLVELLRLALGRFDEMPEKLKNDLEWFSPHARQELLSRAWNKDTEIEVLYSRLGNTYRILWRGSAPTSPSIEKQTDLGWVAEDGDVAERFPLLINSQKQIYEMATDPRSLLALIDQQPDLDYATWRQQYEALTLQYRTQRAEIEEVRNRISEEGRVRGNLADTKILVERLHKLRDSFEAKELDALQDADARHGRLESAAGQLESRLRTALDEYRDERERISPPQSIWEAELDRQKAIAEAVSKAEHAVDQLVSSRADLTRLREQTDPRKVRIAELREELKSPDGLPIEDDISGVASAEISPYEDALARRGRLEGDLERIDRDKARTGTLADSADETLGKVGEHRRLLSTRRGQVVGESPYRVALF